jgi:hypothetical protein
VVFTQIFWGKYIKDSLKRLSLHSQVGWSVVVDAVAGSVLWVPWSESEEFLLSVVLHIRWSDENTYAAYIHGLPS